MEDRGWETPPSILHHHSSILSATAHAAAQPRSTVLGRDFFDGGFDVREAFVEFGIGDGERRAEADGVRAAAEDHHVLLVARFGDGVAEGGVRRDGPDGVGGRELQ